MRALVAGMFQFHWDVLSRDDERAAQARAAPTRSRTHRQQDYARLMHRAAAAHTHQPAGAAGRKGPLDLCPAPPRVWVSCVRRRGCSRPRTPLLSRAGLPQHAVRGEQAAGLRGPRADLAPCVWHRAACCAGAARAGSTREGLAATVVDTQPLPPAHVCDGGARATADGDRAHPARSARGDQHAGAAAAPVHAPLLHGSVSAALPAQLGRPMETTDDDVQLTVRVAYSGNAEFRIDSEMVVNWPVPGFARLPISLTARGLVFDGETQPSAPAPGAHCYTEALCRPTTHTQRQTETRGMHALAERLSVFPLLLCDARTHVHLSLSFRRALFLCLSLSPLLDLAVTLTLVSDACGALTASVLCHRPVVVSYRLR